MELLEKFRSSMAKLETKKKKFTGLDVLVEMIFCCGFRRNEVDKITVGYLKSKNIKDRVSLCWNSIDRHLQYLKQSAGNNFKDDLPLFSEYCGEKGQRKFYRHLSKISFSMDGGKISYDELVRRGMEYFWSNSNINDLKKRKEWISQQFDRSEQTIENILHLNPDRKKTISKNYGTYQHEFLYNLIERKQYNDINNLKRDIWKMLFYTANRRYDKDDKTKEEFTDEALQAVNTILLNDSSPRKQLDFLKLPFNDREIKDVLIEIESRLPELQSKKIEDIENEFPVKNGNDKMLGNESTSFPYDLYRPEINSDYHNSLVLHDDNSLDQMEIEGNFLDSKAENILDALDKRMDKLNKLNITKTITLHKNIFTSINPDIIVESSVLYINLKTNTKFEYLSNVETQKLKNRIFKSISLKREQKDFIDKNFSNFNKEIKMLIKEKYPDFPL